MDSKTFWQIRLRVKRLLLPGALFLGCALAHAQTSNGIDDNLMPSATPPSPQAQAFIRYGDIPVSNYTGIPSINTPLYTIQLKDISIPITLAYDASGIKVEAEAGLAGLGWIFDTGGVITQTMMGKYNDFYSNEVYFNNQSNNYLHDITSLYPNYGPYAVTNYCVSGFPFYGSATEEVWTGFLAQLAGDGERDFAPDVFNYRFQGYSGKFIFRRDGTILKEQEDDVKLEPNISRPATSMGMTLNSWKATTPDGTQYFFNEAEQTRLQYAPYQNFNSSWYLTRIETVSGTVIEFQYGQAPQMLRAFSRRQSSSLTGPSEEVTSRYYAQTYLKKITYPGGSVEMDYSFDRIDLSYAPRLTTMRVRSNAGMAFRWNFLYDYFTANDTTLESPTLARLNAISSGDTYTANWNTKRLKLTGLTRDDNVSTTVDMRYRFWYNEMHLPTKLSAGIDHWGYYNGANNYSLVPTVIQNISRSSGAAELEELGRGANREPNANYNQAFMLTQITYPTGGTTRFTYEPNKYLISNTENDPYKKDYWYGTKTVQLVEGPEYQNVYGDAVHLLTPPFTLPDAHFSVGGKIDVQFRIELADSYTRSTYYDHNFYLSLETTDGSYIPWSYHLKDPELPAPSGMTADNRVINQGQNNIPIYPGTYVLKLRGPLRKFVKNTTLTASYYTNLNLTGQENVGLGGGVRIRSIQSLDANSTTLKHKKFIYTSDGSENETLCSGKLMFYPRYRVDHNRLSSDGLRGGGPSVGYSCVYEVDLDADGTEIGRSAYEYLNKPDLNLCYSWQHKRKNGEVIYASKDENPKGIDGYRYSENGLLLCKKVFRYGAPYTQSWIPGSETRYTYSFYGEGPNIFWGLVKNPKYTEPNPATSCPPQSMMQQFGEYGQCMGYLYPAIRPMRARLVEKKEIFYHDGPEVTKTTKYTYPENHSFVIQETESMSDGREQVTRYKYPFDYTDNTMRALTAANRISTPVETLITIDNTSVVAKRIDQYALFDGKYRLSSVLTATGPNGAMEPRVTYYKYDLYGNPVHVRKDGTDVVCLWSYRGQYPIAEIANSVYNSNIENAVNLQYGISVDALTQQDTPPQPAAGKYLQQNSIFTESLVTTYTYLPMVGLSSVLDPSMRGANYKYDSFGRLTEVTDEKGTPLNKYTYKLKN